MILQIVGEFENTFNLQIWKNFFDQFEVVLVAPNGTRVGPIPERLGTQRFAIGKTELVPRSIVVGNYDLWLPSGGVLSVVTKFLRPS